MPTLCSEDTVLNVFKVGGYCWFEGCGKPETQGTRGRSCPTSLFSKFSKLKGLGCNRKWSLTTLKPLETQIIANEFSVVWSTPVYGFPHTNFEYIEIGRIW